MEESDFDLAQIEEMEKKMWKRAELIERTIRYAVLISIFIVIVAVMCHLAASSSNGCGGRDPWNGAIESALRNLKGENK